MDSHSNGVDPHNQAVPKPVGTSHLDEPDSHTQDIENTDLHLKSVDSGSPIVYESVCFSHLDFQDPDPDAQDIRNTSRDSNAVDTRNLFVSDTFDTLHLNESASNAPDVERIEPVGRPHSTKPDPGARDLEDFATHVHDVSPVRISRSNSAASKFSEAEEVMNVTAGSVRDSAIFVCGMNRLDGSLCHEAFANSASRSRHQTTPVHMRSAPCPSCPSERFWQSLILEAHVKEHHRDKLWTDFRCRICGSKRTATLRGLRYHVGRHHKSLSIEARYDATRGI